jgi:hypothetical protein
VLHATAARTLRSKVDTAYTVLAELTPPPALERAHVDYLEGLSQERSALDDMLEFYGSFSIQLANRAVLRLQESSQRIERARTFVAQVQQEANTSTRWPVQTAR